MQALLSIKRQQDSPSPVHFRSHTPDTMRSLTLTLSILAALSLISLGAPPVVPFDASALNKEFVASSSCSPFNRFPSLSFLRATRKKITYDPPHCSRCEFNPNKLYCTAKIELFLARRGRLPLILRRRLVTVDKGPGVTCAKVQPVEKSRPFGKTRKQFAEALREMARGAIFIRDQAVDPKCQSPPKPSEARFIVGYLIAVAWDFNISI